MVICYDKAPWRMSQRSLCCSLLCGVQLVLSSGVLTVLDLDRWMSCRGLLRSLGRCCLGLVALPVAGGAAGCSQSPSVAPCHFKEPTPLHWFVILCFCSDGSKRHKIWAATSKYEVGSLCVHLCLPCHALSLAEAYVWFRVVW